MTARARLTAAISEKLIPAFLSRGFTGPSVIKGSGLLHEYRRQTPNGAQVATIQLEKHQLPRFVINLHIEPPEGIQSVIKGGGTILSGRLKPKGGATTSSWFRADRPWWDRVVLRRQGTLESEAVDHCVALLEEIDTWWAKQEASAHISTLPITYPGSGK